MNKNDKHYKRACEIYAESDKLPEKHQRCYFRKQLLKDEPEIVERYVRAIGKKRQRASVRNINRMNTAVAIDKGTLKGWKASYGRFREVKT